MGSISRSIRTVDSDLDGKVDNADKVDGEEAADIVTDTRVKSHFPDTIANTLSDHDKATHDSLNIDADTVDGEEAEDLKLWTLDQTVNVTDQGSSLTITLGATYDEVVLRIDSLSTTIGGSNTQVSFTVNGLSTSNYVEIKEGGAKGGGNSEVDLHGGNLGSTYFSGIMWFDGTWDYGPWGWEEVYGNESMTLDQKIVAWEHDSDVTSPLDTIEIFLLDFTNNTFDLTAEVYGRAIA